MDDRPPRPAPRTKPDPWTERRLARRAEPSQPERWYRVEHRHGERARSLGRIAGVPAHIATLDPFRAHLLLTGVAGGHLVLVDEETGAVVARRAVHRPHRRS
jgi:hypothetical protein